MDSKNLKNQIRTDRFDFDEEALIKAAKKIMKEAYAPYSKVKVGAAILSSKGKIHVGCNIENASYGLTVCAERVAVGCAVSHGEREFKAIAIANSTDKIITPCGACRQVLSEFSKGLKILLVSAGGEIVRTTLAQLLPDPFSL